MVRSSCSAASGVLGGKNSNEKVGPFPRRSRMRTFYWYQNALEAAIRSALRALPGMPEQEPIATPKGCETAPLTGTRLGETHARSQLGKCMIKNGAVCGKLSRKCGENFF